MPKTIVITGAGVGLGRAIARRLASEGHTVVLLGRTLATVQAVATELGDRAMAVACDVGLPDSVRAAFATIAKRHPRIDVLINNAAVYEPFLIAEARDEQILNSVATNLAGPIFCCRSAIPMMVPGSHIINVSSESVEMTFPHLAMYQASKAGLERFSRALSVELESNRIRVSMVRAGQMLDPDKPWVGDPVAWGRFREAGLAAGVDLTKRPISHISSVPGVFSMLINLPPDVDVAELALHARATS